MYIHRTIEQKIVDVSQDTLALYWLGLDAIHDTVHEMARDEARHGKAFGLAR